MGNAWDAKKTAFFGNRTCQVARELFLHLLMISLNLLYQNIHFGHT
jgi:hypothetical protein